MEGTDDLSGSASDGYERRRVRISTQILDAAEQLLREHGDDSFTMADVARTSGVSPATPFNHFEHKIGMLAALFRRSLSVVGRMRVRDVGPDPRDRVVEDAVWSADIYARDPSLYRPLLRALLSHPPRGVFKEATQLWVGGLEACLGCVGAACRAGAPEAAQCKSSLTTRPSTPDGGVGAAAAHLGDDGAQPERACARTMMRASPEHIKGRVASNPHTMNTRENPKRASFARRRGRR